MLGEMELIQFGGFMNDDLNIAGAIGWINEQRVNGLLERSIDESRVPNISDAEIDAAWKDPNKPRWEPPIDVFALIDRVLGILSLDRPQALQTSIALFLPGVTPSPEVEALLAKRRDARAAKDFKASDAIRDQLAAMGYAIKDAPGGKVEVGRK